MEYRLKYFGVGRSAYLFVLTVSTGGLDEALTAAYLFVLTVSTGGLDEALNNILHTCLF